MSIDIEQKRQFGASDYFMPKLKIQLPCKASELESKIRAYCEMGGHYDEAIVDVVVVKIAYSYQNFYQLGIFCPEKENAQ